MAIYTAEFKVEAVKLVIDSNLTLVDAAKRLGMPMKTLVFGGAGGGLLGECRRIKAAVASGSCISARTRCQGRARQPQKLGACGARSKSLGGG